MGIDIKLMNKSDLTNIVEWNKDKSAEFLLQWAGPFLSFPLDLKQLENYYDEHCKDFKILKAVDSNNDTMIGMIEIMSFKDIENCNCCRIGHFLIGNESKRGSGFGTSILNKVLDLCFNMYNYDAVTLDVFDYNTGAIKCYENVGFVKGPLRENARTLNGKSYNLYKMTIYNEAFLKKVPSVAFAEQLLEESYKLNPGPWREHVYNVGRAAKLIASNCPDIDEDTAYVLGILHDIGRRFGVGHLKHTINGYNFLMDNGYPLPAKICLTHSFPHKDIKEFFGKKDVTTDQYNFIEAYIDNVKYDDYDRLIQLCDALALPSGCCLLEKRMIDVALRYGCTEFTADKWRDTFKIKEYFEEKMGKSIYDILPGVVENTFN